VQIWFQNAVQSYISMSTYTTGWLQVILSRSLQRVLQISVVTQIVLLHFHFHIDSEIMGQKSLRVWRLA